MFGLGGEVECVKAGALLPHSKKGDAGPPEGGRYKRRRRPLPSFGGQAEGGRYIEHLWGGLGEVGARIGERAIDRAGREL